MRIEEVVNPEDVKLKIAYHDELNPKLWDGFDLKPEVRERLLEIATLFQDFLKLPDLEVVDRVITGSSANYNWTSLSDIDLHLIVNLDSVRPSCSDDVLAEYLQAKKKIWNDLHDITIYGYEVELYAQDAEEQHIATGVFSIEKNEWLLKPEHIEPAIDDVSIKSKSAELMNWIDEIPTGQCSALPEIEHIKEKIRRMRRSGLQEAGEFSVENLTFKTLRNNGYLEKLSDLQNSTTDNCLSLDSE